jgi:hypothetical protein
LVLPTKQVHWPCPGKELRWPAVTSSNLNSFILHALCHLLIPIICLSHLSP